MSLPADVFIDDATGRLMHLRFDETESAFDYMMVTREYLEQHGKPLAFYSDKHGIFRANNGGPLQPASLSFVAYFWNWGSS